ncbi:MAG: cation:proton antiporter [Chloroflexi bacterium]|nr:cation:proton antiporter [Chloroflexota bacterium]
MTPFLQFAIALTIIIAAAKTGGYISNRLGQPAVLGELIAGIILGPSVLNMLHWTPFTDPYLGEGVAHIAELGVLFLMFIAGLELHLSDLAKSGKVSAFAGVLGVVTPLVMGYYLARAFGYEIQPSLFIGLILAATSVSISAQTLLELGVLRTRVGIGLLGAAVFDDILVVLGLSLFIALVEGTGGPTDVLWIVVRMTLYIIIATAIGMKFFARWSQKVNRLPISQGLMAFVVVMMLLYAWAAEALGGMAAITGAFLAGLMFARSPLKERIENSVSVMAYALFVPVFFVNVGLEANARLVFSVSLMLFLGMTVVAIISKMLGAGLGARLAGFTTLESLQLGAGMTSRGEVGLIVATVGINQGLISDDVFAVVVGVVIVTTLVTPAMLRVLFARKTAVA